MGKVPEESALELKDALELRHYANELARKGYALQMSEHRDRAQEIRSANAADGIEDDAEVKIELDFGSEAEQLAIASDFTGHAVRIRYHAGEEEPFKVELSAANASEFSATTLGYASEYLARQDLKDQGFGISSS